MDTLKDNFNKNYDDKISIWYERSKPLHKKNTSTKIEIKKGSRVLLVINENDNGKDMWPQKIYFEVDQNNKSNVMVKNGKKCKVDKDKIDNSKWNITPDPQDTQWFSFDLSLINENKAPMNEIGATVTVGDEGVGGSRKKEKKKKALKNL